MFMKQIIEMFFKEFVSLKGITQFLISSIKIINNILVTKR